MTIFKYLSLHRFLRHYIDALPQRGRGEITKIAKHLRVSSTLVSQVLSCEKLLTPEQGHQLGVYLGLSPLESEYMIYLIQKERAGSSNLKKFWTEKLDAVRSQSLKLANHVKVDRVLTESERSVFYSSHIYAAVHLFVTMDNHGKGIEEVIERFGLTKAKASEILNFLQDTGFCHAERGRFFPGVLKTHLDQGSPHLLRHYSNWRLRAISQSESLGEDDLMYSAPVSISRKDFEILREEMVVFIKHFLERVHASPAEDVAGFNLDFFWVRK